MAIQYSSGIYLGQLDLIESTAGAAAKLSIYTGSPPATCATADSGTKLAVLTLPSDWMQAASGTTKVLAGSWTGTAIAGAGATPGYFRIKDNATDTTCYVQGTVGIGSGDLSLNGTITSGQTITISSFQLNAVNM
jgi:hypothetical protein